jgi:plastocyanin
VRTRTLIGILLVVTAVLGFTACGGGDEEPEATNTPAATATAAAPTTTTAPTATVPADDGGNGATGEVVSVELGENPYIFAPEDLTFDAGTTYALSFPAAGEFHTFTVLELGIDIFILPGELLEEDITPSTAGTFDLICTPHEGLGMVGTVTVQ